MKLEKSTYKPFGLETIETASRDEIAALQAKRLKRTLENVYENVPNYRKKFDAAGVTPSDFKHLDDLEKFPFTTKQDLRESYPFGVFAVPRERVLRVHASSGTTGKPTVVGYTRNDIDLWADLVARSLRACGTRPGMLVHIAVGYGLPTNTARSSRAKVCRKEGLFAGQIEGKGSKINGKITPGAGRASYCYWDSRAYSPTTPSAYAMPRCGRANT